MKIIVNHQIKQVATGSTIHELIKILSINTLKGIAIAVDDTIVPKSEWVSFCLQKDQRVTIITATQGG